MQIRRAKLAEKQKINFNEFSDEPQMTVLEIYAKSGVGSFIFGFEEGCWWSLIGN